MRAQAARRRHCAVALRDRPAEPRADRPISVRHLVPRLDERSPFERCGALGVDQSAEPVTGATRSGGGVARRALRGPRE